MRIGGAVRTVGTCTAVFKNTQQPSTHNNKKHRAPHRTPVGVGGWVGGGLTVVFAEFCRRIELALGFGREQIEPPALGGRYGPLPGPSGLAVVLEERVRLKPT